MLRQLKSTILIGLCVTIQQTHSSHPHIRGSGKSGTCDGYDGVLRIQQGDDGAGAGTAFFLYSVNQLIYADMHNLLPWIHFDYRGNVYDEVNHTKISLHNFTMLGGGYPAADVIDKDMTYPGAPVLDQRKMHKHTFPVEGLGIWSQYFLPVSDFTFNDPSCINKPYLSFSDEKGDPDMRLILGIHNHAPW